MADISNNKKAAIMFGVVFGSFFMAAGVALLGGTIIWLIWPVAIPAAFPGLVGGVLAAKLSWWQAVCLTWLFTLLIKPSGGGACPKDKQ